MKYINNKALSNEDILEFVGNVLLQEQYLLKAKPVSFDTILKSIKIVSRDNNLIIVHSNYNNGLCCYNIFNIDDFHFTSLYPTYGKSYVTQWYSFLEKKFPTYKNDLAKFLGSEKQ